MLEGLPTTTYVAKLLATCMQIAVEHEACYFKERQKL